MLMVGRDESVAGSLKDVVDRWGGDFRVVQDVRWRDEIARFKDAGGRVAHLTMYGSRLGDVIGTVRQCERLMVVVGAEKVPSDIYVMADWNVAVGNQPHSEVAALAVFLDRLMMGMETGQEFEGRFDGKIQVVPTARGKRVVEREEVSPGGGRFELPDK